MVPMDAQSSEVAHPHTPRRSSRAVRPVLTEDISVPMAKLPASAGSGGGGEIRGRYPGRSSDRSGGARASMRNVPNSAVSTVATRSAPASWRPGEVNDIRRIELLKRLNQIERQRNELTRANLSRRESSTHRTGNNNASNSPTDGAPSTSHTHPSRPFSSKRARPSITGDFRGSDSKRRRNDTAIDSNSEPASLHPSGQRRSLRNDPGPPQHSPAVSARAQTSARPPQTPALDLDAVNIARKTSRRLSPDTARDSSTGLHSVGTMQPDGDLNRFISSQSPPGSPGSIARGSARVRTPSVLLAMQPGEGPSAMAQTKSVAKNNQVSYCLRLVKDMLRLKDAYAFSKPIDQLWPRDQLPGYFEMISKPMDLSTIREKLECGAYIKDVSDVPTGGSSFDADEFADDMRLVFNNALVYNRPGDVFHVAAGRLLEKFESKMATLPELKEEASSSTKKNKKKRAEESSGGGGAGGSKKGDIKRRKSPSKLLETKARTSDRGTGKTKLKKSDGDTTRSNAAATRKSDSEISASPKDINKMSTAELEQRLDALRRHIAVSDSGSPSRSPLSGVPAYLTQAQALYHVPMTFEEKYSLSQNVSRLPGDKLQKLVALVSRNTDSTMEVNNEEEIELDIDHMDNKTLRDMEAFVNYTLFRRRGSSAKGGPVSLSFTGLQSDIVQLSRQQADEEATRIEGILRSSRSNGSAGNGGEVGRKTVAPGGSKERSFYDDSDSSSESDSGSSGSDSSDGDSEDGSDSSDDESEESAKLKRRERNLEHMRQRGHGGPVGGTPLPSPSYSGTHGPGHTEIHDMSPPCHGSTAAKAPLRSGAASGHDAMSPASGGASSRSQ